MILDDEELEKGPLMRQWRAEDGKTLTAARIFGSAPKQPKEFPTAFQSYRGSAFTATKPSLWNSKKDSGKPPRRPERRPADGPPGQLIADVKGILGIEPLPVETQNLINDIVTNGIRLEPLKIDVPVVTGAPEEEAYPYAQCTPPPEETKPGGFTPKTPPF
jgi:hypothetical protein